MAWVSIESNSILNPPFLTWFISKAEVESPSIFLSTMVLIDGNCSIDVMRENLESHSIVGPSLTRGLHGSAEMVPPSSVGGTLVVMELMELDCNRIGIIGYMKSDAVKDPSLS